jgi:hypothetical protein
MTRLLVFIILTISIELPAQSAIREGEQYAILSLLIKKLEIKDLFIEPANGYLLSYTDTLQRFRGGKMDSIITIGKVQRQDFMDQLLSSRIRNWDASRVEANLEKENVLRVAGAAMTNDWTLPERYKKFFNRDARVFHISIPIFSIDRKTAYISVSEDQVKFINNKLDTFGDGKAGIYILKNNEGKWSIVNYILVMGGS